MLHLGSRVSALLDGRLSASEEERAWAHVHGCHQCRDLVEREGWIKTQLSGWSGSALTPSRAKQQLLRAPAPVGAPVLVAAPWRPPMALLATGALGTAVLGVLALGMAPASAPSIDRRVPVTTIGGVVHGPSVPAGPGASDAPRIRPSTPTTISVKIGE